MAVHGESDLQLSQDMAAGRAQRSLVLRGCGAIGVQLAINLLDAGYTVYGLDVNSDSRQAFLNAGGQEVSCVRRLPSAGWRIECQELDVPEPELLSRIAARPAYGRARVELAGTHRASDIVPRAPVARLVVRPASRSGSELQIDLHISSRGPELTVRGERSLFEQALSLLTTLSDRVVYDAASSEYPG